MKIDSLLSSKYKYYKTNQKYRTYFNKLVSWGKSSFLPRTAFYLYFYNNNGLHLRVKKSIRFSVGQPMGFYSSWAAMSLSHHTLVLVSYYICLLEDISKRKVGSSEYLYLKTLLRRFEDDPVFKNYSILGDDIVIFDETVATKYLYLLRMLGIGVSIEKCFISKSVSEFAKRYITLKGIFRTLSLNLMSNLIDNKGEKPIEGIRARSIGECISTLGS